VVSDRYVSNKVLPSAAPDTMNYRAGRPHCQMDLPHAVRCCAGRDRTVGQTKDATIQFARRLAQPEVRSGSCCKTIEKVRDVDLPYVSRPALRSVSRDWFLLGVRIVVIEDVTVALP
jgi:hypothetical protein